MLKLLQYCNFIITVMQIKFMLLLLARPAWSRQESEIRARASAFGSDKGVNFFVTRLGGWPSTANSFSPCKRGQWVIINKIFPSPCTAFFQSLSVNSLRWRIRGEREGTSWTTWPETLWPRGIMLGTRQHKSYNQTCTKLIKVPEIIYLNYCKTGLY